ncbi:MAG TPA: site-specific integrase [Cyclobacteriaceae bacterium]|nr:site-specific integrase [Cyclobacteriaceae bacterium]HMV07562.1 site-specific integrase [Cyclobacteriaceae bacterium]HMV89048.1 site-specific integrase [Cyclobacteriaceae bacterium]HMW98697.1 site-specific integrase [Cyclobacteriaceae bacterium]HMX48669.1 site-specific integrase [Cyclobacteriaceae bacterium]
MDKKQFTVEPIIWIHSQNKKGLNPVKIKLTYNRKTKYYPVQLDGKNVFLSQEQWDAINEKTVRKENKRIKEAIGSAEAKARETIQAITSNKRAFTFDRFEREFILNTSSKGFLRFFQDYLNEIKQEGRAGTYHTYNCALQAFIKFRNGTEIDPLDLTPDLLRNFENYLKREKPIRTKAGKTVIIKAGKTTVSIYMRALRAVYNYIAGKLPHLSDHYPFTTHQSDRTKYKIKSGSGSKGDALNIEQLRQFQSIEVIPSSPEWRAKLLWMFSFYCNGMNFNDIARLTYANVKKDSISYIRHKTKETERSEEVIEIPLSDSIREIIIELGNPNKHPSSFIFDILTKNLSPLQERKTINQKIKIVNKWLKKICEANELPPITTYWARHSYASLLKQAGHSVELIREMLGHSDIKTTESYLKRFDLSKKREANERLQLWMKKAG